ncbi:hypothetical protein AALC25_14080, partial [Lachnospiraceae bacterium 29-84]
MCAATFLNSNDVESMAKQQFTNGDIALSLDPANTNAEDRPAGINALQTENPLDEVLEETISDMDGVKNIEFIQGCVSNMEFPTPFKDGNSRRLRNARPRINTGFSLLQNKTTPH